MEPFPKIKSIVQLYDLLPGNERIITDVLRDLVRENLPGHCKEKISYNVPFFYGKKAFASFGRPLYRGAELKKACYWGFGTAIN